VPNEEIAESGHLSRVLYSIYEKRERDIDSLLFLCAYSKQIIEMLSVKMIASGTDCAV